MDKGDAGRIGHDFSLSHSSELNNDVLKSRPAETTGQNVSQSKTEINQSTSGAGQSALNIASSYFPAGPSEFAAAGGKRSHGADFSRLESTSGHGGEVKNVRRTMDEPPIAPVVWPQNAAGLLPQHRSARFEDRSLPPWNPYSLPGQFYGRELPYSFPMPNPFPPNMPKFDGTVGSPGAYPGKASPSGDFDHNYQFRTPLAKGADEKSKKHVQNAGRTIRSIVRMIGTFETAFVTVRGCFYGVLCAVEYGTLGWQMLMNIPVVRMVFDMFRWFWHYIKFVGRNGPLVGVFALICTYVGRACLPAIRSAVQNLRSVGSTATTATVHGVRKVKFTFVAKKPEELTVTAGEDVFIEAGRNTDNVHQLRTNMVLVRRVKPLPGRSTSGLIPKSALANSDGKFE